MWLLKEDKKWPNRISYSKLQEFVVMVLLLKSTHLAWLRTVDGVARG